MSTTFAHSSLRGSGFAHLNKIKQCIDPTPILQSEVISLAVYQHWAQYCFTLKLRLETARFRIVKNKAQ